MKPCECACHVRVKVRGGARSLCVCGFVPFRLGCLRARHTVTTRRLTRQVLPAPRESDERAPQHGLRPPWHQRMRIPRTTSPLMRQKNDKDISVICGTLWAAELTTGQLVGSQCRVVISETRVSSVWNFGKDSGLAHCKKVPPSFKNCLWLSSCTSSEKRKDKQNSFKTPVERTSGLMLRHKLRTCCFLALGCHWIELSRLGSPALYASRRVRMGLWTIISLSLKTHATGHAS